MDTERGVWLKAVSIFLFAAFWTLGLSACTGRGTALLVSSPSPTAIAVSTATPAIFTPLPLVPTSTPVCTDNLTGLKDQTIPDDTVVAPGEVLDKQWLVQNSGSCNWDSRYRLHLNSTDSLGAKTEQALYPARAGMQAIIQIKFTAPLDAGEYYSEWQALDPNGIPFGDVIWIKITVQP